MNRNWSNHKATFLFRLETKLLVLVETASWDDTRWNRLLRISTIVYCSRIINNVDLYPCLPQFNYIEVGFEEVLNYLAC